MISLASTAPLPSAAPLPSDAPARPVPAPPHLPAGGGGGATPAGTTSRFAAAVHHALGSASSSPAAPTPLNRGRPATATAALSVMHSPPVPSPAHNCLPQSRQQFTEECPICTAGTLLEALDTEAEGLGSLDCCDHLFCHGCIARWVTDFTNTCPLCKKEASELVRRQRSEDGRIRAESVQLEAREARGRLDEMSEAEIEALIANDEAAMNCVECGSGEEDHLILLCDACNSGYHTYCCGLGRTVPAGDWYCPTCAPIHAPAQRAQQAMAQGQREQQQRARQEHDERLQEREEQRRQRERRERVMQRQEREARRKREREATKREREATKRERRLPRQQKQKMPRRPQQERRPTHKQHQLRLDECGGGGPRSTRGGERERQPRNLSPRSDFAARAAGRLAGVVSVISDDEDASEDLDDDDDDDDDDDEDDDDDDDNEEEEEEEEDSGEEEEEEEEEGGEEEEEDEDRPLHRGPTRAVAVPPRPAARPGTSRSAYPTVLSDDEFDFAVAPRAARAAPRRPPAQSNAQLSAATAVNSAVHPRTADGALEQGWRLRAHAPKPSAASAPATWKPKRQGGGPSEKRQTSRSAHIASSSSSSSSNCAAVGSGAGTNQGALSRFFTAPRAHEAVDLTRGRDSPQPALAERGRKRCNVVIDSDEE